MAEYDFFAGILRFVASTSERTDPRVTAMMECLDRAAVDIDAKSSFDVPYGQREYYARALAGVAGFLQRNILPETVAEQNKQAEAQVRWVIDTSMDCMSKILQAQTLENQDDLTLEFPPPPVFEEE